MKKSAAIGRNMGLSPFQFKRKYTKVCVNNANYLVRFDKWFDGIFKIDKKCYSVYSIPSYACLIRCKAYGISIRQGDSQLDGKKKEKEIRHELMQHIIDSRGGITNTNSTHYAYLANLFLSISARSVSYCFGGDR